MSEAIADAAMKDDHAHEEVQAAADYVTGSNAEDGVAVVIEEMILPTLK